jgi:hypothetical protein
MELSSPSPLNSNLIMVSIKLVAKRHNELSKEDTPTCTRLYPTLEMLMSDWEELLENKEFESVHDALRAGIALLEKYYRRADDTNVYFISHSKSRPLAISIEFNYYEHIVLDPVTKLTYLEAAWEEEYIEMGKKHLNDQVSLHITYEYLNLIVSFSFLSIRPSMKLRRKIQWLRMTAIKNPKYVSH